MKTKRLIAAALTIPATILAAALFAPAAEAHDGVRVSGLSIAIDIGAPPPPLRYEPVPPPRIDFFWIPGYWGWDGYRHAWVEGYWERQRPGYIYLPGAWEHRGERWHYEPGNWRRHEERRDWDHDDHDRDDGEGHHDHGRHGDDR